MRVAVLGGGVTGLTAAWKLAKAGHKVRVFEAAPQSGGVIRTQIVDGWVAEAGPISFQEASPEIAAVIADLGLANERLVASPASENRFIARKGKLVAVPTPSSMGAFLATPLLSFRSKLTVGAETSRSPVKRSADISVAALVRDHFGDEVLENFVQPLIGGIYAGDAERLSAQYAFPKIWEAERTVGSLVRAATEGSKKRKEQGLSSAPALVSFKRGLQALPEALAGHLPEGTVLNDAAVTGIGPGKGARWVVRWTTKNAAETAEFDWVVAALPASALAALEIGTAGAKPLSGLSAIEYAPVAALSLGYKRSQVAHPLDGFGALVPASEKCTLLGVIFTSSLFNGRAPEGHVLVNVFAGGALRRDVALLPSAALSERVRADLKRLIGAEGVPAFERHTPWPRAIPQYNLGHGVHLEAMARCENAHPGLLIGGNIRDGISLPDCIRSGLSLANRVS
jgi:protoporphyrinogen/coproporphyrinogen III oxidase